MYQCTVCGKMYEDLPEQCDNCGAEPSDFVEAD